MYVRIVCVRVRVHMHIHRLAPGCASSSSGLAGESVVAFTGADGRLLPGSGPGAGAEDRVSAAENAAGLNDDKSNAGADLGAAGAGGAAAPAGAVDVLVGTLVSIGGSRLRSNRSPLVTLVFACSSRLPSVAVGALATSS